MARSTGSTLLIGGSTAVGIDFASVLAGKLPLFVAVVIVLAGVLLVLAFRSIAIPIQAAVMNLLSVGASLGIAVAIFQRSWLGGLFNVKEGPVFLDAFVVRSLLLPLVLTLLGDRTWALPRRLARRLPQITIESPSQVRPQLSPVPVRVDG